MNKKILQALAWLVLIIGLIAAGCALGQSIEFRPASLTAQAPAWGVGRAEAHIGGYLSPVCQDGYHSIAEYAEGEGDPPYWYRPDEEMAVEWYAPVAHPPVGVDPGGVDWNIETELVGWNEHRMAVWEMDLFSRIVYLEFGISSQECREAGIDAILRLWESNYYSSTMFGTLSAVTENGKPAFSTYPDVWNEEYDYEKLAWIREDCEERFVNGPVWIAPFFRTGYYHDWAVPCYCFPEDNVYFSTGKGW